MPTSTAVFQEGVNGFNPRLNVGNFGNSNDLNRVVCTARKRLKDVATRCVLGAVIASKCVRLRPDPAGGAYSIFLDP